MYKIESLTTSDIPQCRVTLVQLFDATVIPVFVMNWLVPVALGVVNKVRDEFAKDEEVDGATFLELRAEIDKEDHSYTAKEAALLDDTHQYFGKLDHLR